MATTVRRVRHTVHIEIDIVIDRLIFALTGETPNRPPTDWPDDMTNFI